MGFIVIDTCVWIDLASTPKLRPLLEALAKFLNSPNHTLAVPASVRTEFARHEDACRTSWAQSFQGHLKGLKHVYQAVPETKADLLRVREIAESKLQKSRGSIRDGVDLAISIVDGVTPTPHLPDDYEDSCRRCLNLQAPAVVKNRSSVGDCLLWLSVLRLLETDSVWFCTKNTSDFSERTKTDELHADLQAEAAEKANSLVFYSDPSMLIEALRTAENEPADTLPHFYDHVQRAPMSCPSCKAEGTFTSGAYLRSQLGGLTWQFVCTSCGFRFDTGDFWD